MCSYFLSQSIIQKREDYSIGVGFASDTLIVLTGIFLGIFIRLSVISNLLWSNIVILISIGLVILISLIASFRAKQGRHLYFAQTSIASLYLALKDYFPEIDNLDLVDDLEFWKWFYYFQGQYHKIKELIS